MYLTFSRVFLIIVISCTLFLFLAGHFYAAISCTFIVIIQRTAVLIADVFFDFFTGRPLIRARKPYEYQPVAKNSRVPAE